MNHCKLLKADPANGTEVVARARAHEAWVQGVLRGEESVLRIERGTDPTRVAGFMRCVFAYLCMSDPDIAMHQEASIALTEATRDVVGDALFAPGSDEQKHEETKRRLLAHKASCSTPVGCGACAFADVVAPKASP